MDLRKQPRWDLRCLSSVEDVFSFSFLSFGKILSLPAWQGAINYFVGIWVRFVPPFPLVFDHPVILDRNMNFLSCFMFSSGFLGPSVPLLSTPIQCLLQVSTAGPPVPLFFDLGPLVLQLLSTTGPPVPLLFDPIQPSRPVSSLVVSTVTAWILQFNISMAIMCNNLSCANALDPRHFPCVHRLHLKIPTLVGLLCHNSICRPRDHLDFDTFHDMSNMNKWTNERTNKQTNERTNWQTNERTNEWTNELVDHSLHPFRLI